MRDLTIFFRPSCSNAFLNSGWNTIIRAIIPTLMVLVIIHKITFNSNNTANSQKNMMTTRPFTNVQALVFLTHFTTWYKRNARIMISMISVGSTLGSVSHTKSLLKKSLIASICPLSYFSTYLLSSYRFSSL